MSNAIKAKHSTILELPAGKQMKSDVYLKLKDSCHHNSIKSLHSSVSVLQLHLHLGGCFHSRESRGLNKKMEVKDRKEQKRVSKQTFHKHSPPLTSSFVCVMDVLWDWWCWTQLLSIVSSKRQQNRITYHLSLCERDLWRIWRTYEWSEEKKNRLEGEYWHMGYQFPNRKTIQNMHVCQRDMLQ